MLGLALAGVNTNAGGDRVNARPGVTGHDRTQHNTTKRDQAQPNTTKQSKTRISIKTRHNSTQQDGTQRDVTRQDKTGQDTDFISRPDTTELDMNQT